MQERVREGQKEGESARKWWGMKRGGMIGWRDEWTKREGGREREEKRREKKEKQADRNKKKGPAEKRKNGLAVRVL